MLMDYLCMLIDNKIVYRIILLTSAVNYYLLKNVEFYWKQRRFTSGFKHSHCNES